MNVARGLSITAHLSMSRDLKVMTLLPQLRSALSTNKSDNSSPSATRDNEICHVIMS